MCYCRPGLRMPFCVNCAPVMYEEIKRLRAELASASLYKPCRRTDTPHVPVKAIGECNFDFFGLETDEEFSAWGKPHQEATE